MSAVAGPDLILVILGCILSGVGALWLRVHSVQQKAIERLEGKVDALIERIVRLEEFLGARKV